MPNGVNGVCDSQEGKDLHSKERTWTIRRVQADTIDLVKEAADSEGMKIGAWVDHQLRQAASNALGGGGNHLVQDLSRLSLRAEDEYAKLRDERIESLEKGLDQVLKGQHLIMTMFSKSNDQTEA